MPQIQLDATLFATALVTVLVIMDPLGKLLRPGAGGHGDGEADSTNVALVPLGTPLLAVESWVRSGVS